MPIPKLYTKNYSSSQNNNSNRKYFLKKHGLVSRIREVRLKNFFLLFAGLAVFGFVVSFIALLWFSRGLPDPNKLIEREVAQSTKILDRTGEKVLYEVSGEQKRTMINLSDLPAYVKNATIAIEDKNFYKHKGFSILAIVRTVVTNVIYGKKAGGSTLTQQFIKNAILTNEKTYTRKIKELAMAYKLERKFSKDQILQMYLNEIPYGSNAYGVEAASQKYFAKSAKDLSLAEAAALSALPQAPSRYSPFGVHRDLLIKRQQYILDIMVEQNYINQEEADAAKKEELKFAKPTDNIIAPHFVMFIKEYLSDKYGEKTIEQGGLKIYTTLDLYKQKIAEDVINEKSEANLKKYNASNAALVSIDPKTGQILAMVGSKDYFDDKIDGQVNITTSQRQPGSSIKPIVYAAAFIKGYTPDTMLYDVNTNFSTDPAKPYEPRNYDLAEHGPIQMKKALAGSLNIPAVKTIYLTGVEKVLDLANDLGYTTLRDKNRFGLSLVLGGGEVKMIEHVNAYSAFAREGILHSVSGILKVEDKNGQILEEYKEEDGKKVLDPKVAREINNVLSDNNNRAFIFGTSNWLTLGKRPVAAKTGTTNDFRDAWTIGYTPSLVTGVWAGNNDNSAMKKGADGSQVAAPIWNAYMKAVLGDTPIEYFTKDEPIITGKPILDGTLSATTTIKIDKSTGLLATDQTPADMIEERAYKSHHSELYYISKDDPRGEAPKNPGDDPQFILWEKGVQTWAAKIGEASSTPPQDFDNLHTASNTPSLKIIYPGTNENINTPFVSIRVEASAPRGIKSIEYLIEDNLIGISTEYPFTLDKDLSFLAPGYYSLKARACDDVKNCVEQTVDFNLQINKTGGSEPTATWVSPSSGLAVTNIDFPLSLKISVTDFRQIAKINYYLQVGDSAPTKLGTINEVGAINEFKWENTPTTGTYRITAEAVAWTNKKIPLSEVVIIVNNIKK